MKCKDRVRQAILSGCLNNDDTMDKLITIAYYMGREVKAKERADEFSALLARMRERADACRYNHMANSVIDDPSLESLGSREYIYDPDYSGDITNEFGDDETSL